MKRQTRGAHKRRRARIEDALHAWDLRSKGNSLRDIVKAMSLSGPQQASNLLEKGFKEFYSPQVNQRRAESDALHQSMKIELSRIFFDRKKPIDERLAAAAELRRIDRENRMLHGTDVPEASVQLTGEIAVKDVRQRLLDRLTALAESAAARADDSQPDG